MRFWTDAGAFWANTPRWCPSQNRQSLDAYVVSRFDLRFLDVWDGTCGLPERVSV